MLNVTQAPGDILDYKVVAQNVLQPGEIITGVTWNGGGLTVNSSSFDATTTTAWITGGVAGQTYNVTITVTTNQNRTYVVTMSITVQIKSVVVD